MCPDSRTAGNPVLRVAALVVSEGEPSAATTAADTSGALAPEVHAGHQPASLRRRVLRELLSWLWVILAFLLITGTIVQARVIPSSSMERTLLIGDHLLMSRIGYNAGLPFTQFDLRLWREPQRQQMIIFRSPNEDGQDLIKRLIGLPGDTIEIRAGVVSINGVPLAEPYRSGPPNPSDDYGPASVPPQSYFVLGDNRDNSRDSRFWGFVPDANLIGRAFFIWMNWDGGPDLRRIGTTIQ